jgi:hypothetical protein
MNYAALSSAINLYAENFETGFTSSVDGFIRAAEQRIYNLANIPASNQNQQLTLTANNKFFTLPAGFLSVNELEVVPASGNSVSLLNKEVSFIREAYPNATTTGVPKYYAQYSDTQLILAPTPDLSYNVEVHFFGYPESIVTAGTTWLGDNYDQTLLYGALIEAAAFQKSNVGEELGDYGMYKERFDSAMQLLTRQVGERNNTDNYRTGRKG